LLVICNRSRLLQHDFMMRFSRFFLHYQFLVVLRFDCFLLVELVVICRREGHLVLIYRLDCFPIPAVLKILRVLRLNWLFKCRGLDDLLLLLRFLKRPNRLGHRRSRMSVAETAAVADIYVAQNMLGECLSAVDADSERIVLPIWSTSYVQINRHFICSFSACLHNRAAGEIRRPE